MVGDIIHYVVQDGGCRAAIVVGVEEDGSLDLVYFLNAEFGDRYRSQVRHGMPRSIGHWHKKEECTRGHKEGAP